MSQSEPIRLRAELRSAEATQVGQVTLAIGGQPVAFEFEVPVPPTSLAAMLPILRGVTNAAVGQGMAQVEAAGRTVSCQAGCSACCRQAVPVSESEARALAALVEALPEPRRSEIRARFAEAEQRFAASGLRSELEGAPDEEGLIDLGVDYFGLHIACPFLEADSCSIHPDRPLRCREHMVTSPAQLCALMVSGVVEGVPLPAYLSRALYQVDRDQTDKGWLLLIHALSWVADHPDPPRERLAQDWLAAVLSRMTGG